MEEQLDLGLIAACQQGDPVAFRQVFERYQDRVYRLCRHLAGNPQDAEDLAQESFVQAFGRIQSFRAESAFGTGSSASSPTAASAPCGNGAPPLCRWTKNSALALAA